MSKTVSPGRDASHTHWYLHYQFQAGKSIYKNKSSVDEREYNETPIGSRFLITYLPEAPDSMVATGVVTMNTVITEMIILTLILGSVDLCLVWFAVYKETTLRNHIRLLRDGIEVQAIVASKRSTGTWSSTDRSCYWITCNFYAGSRATSKEFLVWLDFYNAVTTGSSLSALYLPDRPEINGLYRTIRDVVILR